ncbi:hypothetical protein PoB_005049300 [Plakobranchus ocellatus]|uniref:Uncharacterized protein n=1 Tax=Plakobranchus ocellatus TaxID=259542 RepID=A0AAV4BXN3_9GAST|nr:hypothetical protein PoB_005049300 [Plakobranchus ocellatus]
MQAVAAYLRKFIDTVTIGKKGPDTVNSKKKKNARSLDSGIGSYDEDVDSELGRDDDDIGEEIIVPRNNDIDDRQRGEHLKIPAYRLQGLGVKDDVCGAKALESTQGSAVAQHDWKNDRERLIVTVPTCKKVQILSFTPSEHEKSYKDDHLADGLRFADSFDDGDEDSDSCQENKPVDLASTAQCTYPGENEKSLEIAEDSTLSTKILHEEIPTYQTFSRSVSVDQPIFLTPPSSPIDPVLASNDDNQSQPFSSSQANHMTELTSDVCPDPQSVSDDLTKYSAPVLETSQKKQDMPVVVSNDFNRQNTNKEDEDQCFLKASNLNTDPGSQGDAENAIEETKEEIADDGNEKQTIGTSTSDQQAKITYTKTINSTKNKFNGCDIPLSQDPATQVAQEPGVNEHSESSDLPSCSDQNAPAQIIRPNGPVSTDPPEPSDQTTVNNCSPTFLPTETSISCSSTARPSNLKAVGPVPPSVDYVHSEKDQMEPKRVEAEQSSKEHERPESSQITNDKKARSLQPDTQINENKVATQTDNNIDHEEIKSEVMSLCEEIICQNGSTGTVKLATDSNFKNLQDSQSVKEIDSERNSETGLQKEEETFSPIDNTQGKKEYEYRPLNTDNQYNVSGSMAASVSEDGPDSQIILTSVENSLTESAERTDSPPVEHYYTLAVPSTLDESSSDENEDNKAAEDNQCTIPESDSSTVRSERKILRDENLNNTETSKHLTTNNVQVEESSHHLKTVDKNGNKDNIISMLNEMHENLNTLRNKSNSAVIACKFSPSSPQHFKTNYNCVSDSSDDEDPTEITCLVEGEHVDDDDDDEGSDSDSCCSDCNNHSSDSSSSDDSSDEEFINIIKNSKFKVLPVIYEAEEHHHCSDQEEDAAQDDNVFYDTLDLSPVHSNLKANKFSELLISSNRKVDLKTESSKVGNSDSSSNNSIRNIRSSNDLSTTNNAITCLKARSSRSQIIHSHTLAKDINMSEIFHTNTAFLTDKELQNYRTIVSLLSKVWMPKGYCKKFPLATLKEVLKSRCASLGLTPGKNLTPEAGRVLMVIAFLPFISLLDQFNRFRQKVALIYWPFYTAL